MAKSHKVFTLLAFLFTALFGFSVGMATQHRMLSPDRVILPQERHTVIHHRDSLSEWQTLQLAMIKTESDFNPLAVGKVGDTGILQLTKIYIAEVNRILGKDEYIHEDAFSPERSLEMFSIVQANYNPERDIYKAMTLHNPRGESIGYSKRILQNIKWINQYEYIRSLVMEID